MLRGFGEEHASAIVEARTERPFRSVADRAARSGLDQGRLTTRAEAGALEPIAGRERRKVAWEVQGLWTGLPLFVGLGRSEPAPDLPPLDTLSLLQADFRTVGVSVDLHPISLVRDQLAERGCVPIDHLQSIPSGSAVRIGGLVSSRQRPGTASGVVFLTLEDETGMANLVVWPRTWTEHRKLARTATMLGVDGHLQRQDEAVSVLVDRFWVMPEPAAAAAEPRLATLPLRSRDFH
jgi:error-prone DNA polymerase